MLRFKKYIDSHDIWLEDWMREFAMPLSEELELKEKSFTEVKSKKGFKRYLKYVALQDPKFKGFDWDSPAKEDRVGAGNQSFEDLIELIRIAVPSHDPKEVSSNEIITVGGTTWTNKSGKYRGVTGPVIDGNSIVFYYAGLDSRSGNTRIQELSFLFVLASKYYPMSGEALFSKRQFEYVQSKIEEKGAKVDEKALNDCYEFINDAGNKQWKSSWEEATDTFITKFPIGNPPLRFIKDSSKFDLNKQAEELFKVDKKLASEIKWDSDKWNPADVWLSWQTADKIFLEQDASIVDLNAKLSGWLKNKDMTSGDGIIGLSLKLGKNYTENYPESETYRIASSSEDSEVPNGFKLYFGQFFGQSLNQALSLEYVNSESGSNVDRHEIVYRLFTGKAGDTLIGEVTVKGTSAAHGKVYLEYIDNSAKTTKISEVMKRVRSSNIVTTEGDRIVLTTEGNRIFKACVPMWSQLKRGIAVGIVDNKVRQLKGGANRDLKANLIDEYGIFDDVNAIVDTPEFSYDDGKETRRGGSTRIRRTTVMDRGFRRGVSKKEKKAAEAVMNSKFENEINEYAKKQGKWPKSLTGKAAKLNVILSARFQTIVFGGWWSRIFLSNKPLAMDAALGMMLHAKSMNPRFSAPHAKIT
tara:strand:- start:5 stop:1921 length:1917 start_codon:yes stop_codon:yes gene_type:complete